MDIVERIRKYDCSDGGHSDVVGGTIYELAEEAACEIERLRSLADSLGEDLQNYIKAKA